MRRGELVEQAGDGGEAGVGGEVGEREDLEGFGGLGGVGGGAEELKELGGEGLGCIRDAERGEEGVEAFEADGGGDAGAAVADGFEDFDFDAAALEDGRDDGGGLGVGGGKVGEATEDLDAGGLRRGEFAADRAGDEQAGGGEFAANQRPGVRDKPAKAGHVRAVAAADEERGGRVCGGKRRGMHRHRCCDDRFFREEAPEDSGFDGLDGDQGVGGREEGEFCGERCVLVKDFNRNAVAKMELAVADVVGEDGERK